MFEPIGAADAHADKVVTTVLASFSVRAVLTSVQALLLTADHRMAEPSMARLRDDGVGRSLGTAPQRFAPAPPAWPANTRATTATATNLRISLLVLPALPLLAPSVPRTEIWGNRAASPRRTGVSVRTHLNNRVLPVSGRECVAHACDCAVCRPAADCGGAPGHSAELGRYPEVRSFDYRCC